MQRCSRTAALQPCEAAGEARFYFTCAVPGEFSFAWSGLQFSDCRAYQFECAPRLLHAVFVVNRELLGGLDCGFERILRVFREQGRFISLARAGRLVQHFPQRNGARVIELPFCELSQFLLC